MLKTKRLKNHVTNHIKDQIKDHAKEPTLFQKSFFEKTFKAIYSKPRLFLYIFLLDVAFLAIFYLINLLVNSLLPSNPNFISSAQANTLVFIAIILGVIAYFIIMVLVYSFFSLVILGNIKSYSSDHRHDFSMFKNMFVLNILLFMLFFILVVIFNLLLGLLTGMSIWLAIIIGVVFLAIVLLVYAFYSFSHSAFILGHELKTNLKNSLKHIFTRSYLGIFLSSMIIIGVYILLYMLAGVIFQNYIVSNYDSFVNITSYITIIVAYLLFSFNRIYFFFIAEKHIGSKS